MKTRLAMAIDTRRCVGCSACVIACKEENGVPLTGFRSWVEDETRGTYPNLAMEIRRQSCEQCSDAPCVANCPTGASFYGERSTHHGVRGRRRRLSGCRVQSALRPRLHR